LLIVTNEISGSTATGQFDPDLPLP